VGQGQIALRVMELPPPPTVCSVPDISWTMIILLIGLMASIWVFRKKLMEDEGYG